MFENELLDLDTWAKVRKVAPKVTGVSYGQARDVFKSLQKAAEGLDKTDDGNGQNYWQVSLKDISADNDGMDLKLVGRACRELGLTLWRKSDGYHVAWSVSQILILKEFFKI